MLFAMGHVEMSFRGLALLLALPFFLCIPLACASKAPVELGSVRGRAVDESGNPLPGITVTLQSTDGKAVQTVTTSEDGSFAFPAAPVGQYRLVSEFAGFSTPRPLAVTVSPGGLALPPPLVLASPGE